MAEFTPNYNLKKPAEEDFYNINDHNDNMDIIDTALKAHDDALATKETPAGAQAKAEAALAAAKAYTDQEVAEVSQALDAHKAAAAPHSGHETPAGAQAKAEAAAGAVQAELDAHKSDDTRHVIKDGTLQTGLNSEMLGGKTFDKFVLAESTIQTRIYNGIFQYYDNGEWKDVSVIANTFRTADLIQENVATNTWLTALNIIGKGVLYRISGAATTDRSTGRRGIPSYKLEIEVTIDGVVQSVTVPEETYTRGIGGTRSQFMDIITYIKFDSSLQVRIKHNDGSAKDLFCTIDYGLI